jgi:hypothetical protein
MRHYSKGVPGGLVLLCDWTGSALPRALPFAVLAAAYGALVEHFCEQFTTDLFVHTYPYHVLAFVTGFSLAHVHTPSFPHAHAYTRGCGGVRNIYIYIHIRIHIPIYIYTCTYVLYLDAF